MAKELDVNTVDEDVIQVPVSLENLSAKEQVEKLAIDMFGKTMQNIYLETLLEEIKNLKSITNKSPVEREKLLKYLQEIDSICWYTKSKQDIKIQTKLGTVGEVFNRITD